MARSNETSQLLPDILSLRFLGVGNAQAVELGSSSAVLEANGKPLLLIDCGPDTLNRFRHSYNSAEPPALFITHTHFDHIGGLEGWFYRLMTDYRDHVPKLYIPVKLLPILQRRIADYPNFLAEGGSNFWEAFQLIPVSERFWLNNLLFDVFPVRHHEHDTAFGLALKGHFLFTGDTLPIPEILIRFASHGELIFHDCAVQASPSHTSLDEIRRAYRPEQWGRMIFYHYASEADRQSIEEAGL
ncbi:MAG: MBL fold metallo-hydrolase, partial [Candidatus Thiodiazotropha sp. (ex Ctena orbiculata)]|nr:MBL fold metallo-hydrolase [Candidatus Thiodiazotropha taylori]